MGRPVSTARDDELLAGVELEAVNTSLVASVPHDTLPTVHPPQTGSPVRTSRAQDTAAHTDVPDAVLVSPVLRHQAPAHSARLEARHDLVGLSLQLVAGLGEILLGEGFDDVHIKPVSIVRLDLVVVHAGLLHLTDLLPQSDILQVETLELGLDLREEGGEVGLVRVRQEAVVTAATSVFPPSSPSAPARFPAAGWKTERVDGGLGTVLHQLVELTAVMFAVGGERFAGRVAGCHCLNMFVKEHLQTVEMSSDNLLFTF